MESKQKMKRLLLAVVIVIAAIAAVMAISFVRGDGSGEERQQTIIIRGVNGRLQCNSFLQRYKGLRNGL